MIEIKNISKKFGNFLALENVNLEFKKNESVVIAGQNGAGKTTLIRTILGEYIPTGGYVKIDGVDPVKERKQALKNIGFVPQLPPPIKLSVKELINYAAISCEIGEKKIFELCQKMDFDAEAQQKKLFLKLSGGMKQKLLIAIALSKEPNIFIFDEPTANLDPKGRESFLELVKTYKNEHTMLFISHRLNEIKDLANRKLELDLGKVVSDEKLM